MIIERYDRAGWLEARRADHRIGGTSAAAVLGVNKWRSAWDEYGQRILGHVEDHDDATLRRFALGHRMEPIVLATYEDETGHAYEHCDDLLIVHPEHPWAVASPDAIAPSLEAPEFGIEAKISARYDQWDKTGGEIASVADYHEGLFPRQYAIQCYWYLECTGLPWWDLVALVGHDLIIYRLHRDEDAQRRLLERVSEWRERHLVGEEPPPMDGSAAAGRYLLDRRPTEDAREADKAEAGMVEEWRRRKAAIKADQTEAKRLQHLIDERMGDHRRLLMGDGSRVQRVDVAGRRSIDAKRLRADHPEIADEYTKEGRPSWSLRSYGEPK